MVTIGTLQWKVQVEKAKEAKKQAEEVGSQVENAKESMQNADEQTEGLTDKLGGLKDVQEAAGKGFDKMNAKAGFLGTALEFVGGIIAGIVGSLLSLKALLVGTVIAAVVALAVAWQKNFGNLKQKTKNVVKFVKSALMGTVNFIQNIWNPAVKGMKTSWTKNGDAIKSKASDLSNHLENVMGDFLGWFMPRWKDFTGQFLELWKVHAGPLAEEVGETFSVFLTRGKQLINVFTPLWDRFGGHIVQIASGYWKVMKNIVLTVMDAILTSIRVILNIIQGDWGEAWSAIEGFLDRTMGRMAGILQGAVDILGGIVWTIIDAIKWPFEWLYNFLVGASLIPDLINSIANVFGGAISTIMGPVNAMIDALLFPFKVIAGYMDGDYDSIPELARAAITGYMEAVRDLRSEVHQAVGQIAGAAEDVLNDLIDDARSMGRDFIMELADGIIAAKDEVINAVEEVVSGARAKLPSSPAEEGPLSDLDQVGPGFVKTIATGIEAESNELVSATENAMRSVDQQLTSQNVRTNEVVKRGGSGTGGSGSEMNKIEVNIGGVEIGDQTLDISQMTRQDLRRLASVIAEELGDEVRRITT